jgi:hypothetical protein
LGAVLIRYDMEYITKSSERNIKSYKIEFESDRCSIPLSETHFAEKWRIDLTTIVLSNYFALLRNEKICFLREQYEANDNTWKTYSVQLRLERTKTMIPTATSNAKAPTAIPTIAKHKR